MGKGGIGRKGSFQRIFRRSLPLHGPGDGDEGGGRVRLAGRRLHLFVLRLFFLRLFEGGQIYVLVASREALFALIFVPVQSRVKNCSSFFRQRSNILPYGVYQILNGRACGGIRGEHF